MTPTANARIRNIAIVFALFASIIVLRLIHLQVVQHDYYLVLASEEHLSKFEIAPRRGRIYLQDRDEPVPIALNRNLKTLYADTRYITDLNETAEKLKDILGDDFSDKLSSDKPYLVLKSEVPLESADKIEDLELPGIGLVDNYKRVYPEGSLAAQVLGFVNVDGAGQYGIEEFLDKKLGGVPGLLNAKTDTRGIPIATSDNIQIEPTNGDDVILTIDRNIQAYVEKVLEEGFKETRARSISAIVMDVNTGAIRAMANYPTFDPNQYSKVSDYSVFLNQAATGLFEPGSGFKIFAMSTGLDASVVTPNSTYYDAGYVRVDDYTIKNAEGGGTMRTMTEVITRSVNTGVVHVLSRLGGGSINLSGKQILYDYYTKHFHLDKKTGIEQPGEPELHMDKPDEVSDVNYANMTFGQGISTTMVRMVASAAAVINGGTLRQPYLVESIVSPLGEVTKTEPKVVADQVISKGTSNTLKLMMETVVEEGGGFGTKIPGYRIGGKTGTAQIPNSSGGYYTDRDIGSFTGFAPFDDPQYAMMVRVDEPQIYGYAGSAAAGPIFGDIMQWLLKYSGTPPTEVN